MKQDNNKRLPTLEEILSTEPEVDLYIEEESIKVNDGSIEPSYKDVNFAFSETRITYRINDSFLTVSRSGSIDDKEGDWSVTDNDNEDSIEICNIADIADIDSHIEDWHKSEAQNNLAPGTLPEIFEKAIDPMYDENVERKVEYISETPNYNDDDDEE